MTDLSAQDVWQAAAVAFSRVEPISVSPLEFWVILAAAIGLSAPERTWKYFGYIVLIVHELGHAFAALTTGQFVKGITLHLDHSGATNTLTRGGWRAIWSAFWGYPAPALVGAIFIWSAFTGWSQSVATAAGLVLVLSLIFLRNLAGIAITLGAAAALGLTFWYAPDGLTSHLMLILGIALMVGAVRDWVNVASVHTKRRTELDSSDAYILFRRTGIPSPVWLLGFAAAIVGSALLAVWAGPMGNSINPLQLLPGRGA